MRLSAKNKKAFTLLEIILIISIVSIITSIALIKLSSNSIVDAKNNIISDLNWTRLLALSYSVVDESLDYYKAFWQFSIHCIAGGKTQTCKANPRGKEIGYTVFSDHSKTGNPDLNEITQDYLVYNKKLGAPYAGIKVDPNNYTSRTNLTRTYGIKDAGFFYQTARGSGKVQSISFNEFANPILLSKSGNIFATTLIALRLDTATKPSKSTSYCILIHPYTGYVELPQKDKNGEIVWYTGAKKKAVYCHNLKTN